MKIILVGKGSSGKTLLKKRFIERGFKESISYTTRPPRDGEHDGIDYHFIDDATFLSMIEKKEFVEWNFYSDKKWYYGTTLREFNKSEIFILTPSGVKSLSNEDRKKCFVIYLDVPLKVRKQRLNDRGDESDLPARRLRTDEKDFKGFTDYDMLVKNHDF